MHDDEFEILLFRRCSTLHGAAQVVDVGKRNGRRTPFFRPDWAALSNTDGEERVLDPQRLEEACMNLTALERKTWLQILGGHTIADIARDQRVSRAALYIRIRGKDGTGGMVAKNPFVCVWWELRRQGIKT